MSGVFVGFFGRTAPMALVVVAAACTSTNDTSSARHETARRVGVATSALTVGPTLADADTFINSAHPDNNNGKSDSMFTGKNGQAGLMRGLVHFPIPASLKGRATVTSATLTMTTLAAGGGGPGVAGTVSLSALTSPAFAWGEGTGSANVAMAYTVGQVCTADGATWSFAKCTNGAWSGGGGGNGGASSASSAVPSAVEAQVTWTSAAMIADVQGWLDRTTANNGWLITSDSEVGVMTGRIQRFYSREVAAKGPTLSVAASCNAGLTAVGDECTTCNAAANASCKVDQLVNTCVDPGAAAPNNNTYSCTCGAGFIGTGTAACVAVAGGCTGADNPCGAGGGTCTAVGGNGATAWTCSCGLGYVSTGGAMPTCADANACNAAANASCQTSAEIGNNTCVDEAPPSTAYHCACGAGFTGTGTGSCIDPLADAGADAGVDASDGDAGSDGAAADASAIIDADVPPVIDAAVASDAAVSSPPTTTTSADDDGCACNVIGRGTSRSNVGVVTLAVAFTLLMARRRRRAT